MLSHCSLVQLFSTLWTVTCQAPLSMEFSRQEYWSGLPCLPQTNHFTSLCFSNSWLILHSSQVALEVKNLPANAGDTRDAGSIPGSGRSPEKEMATQSNILVWEILWSEEPGGILHMHIHIPHSAAKGDKGAFLIPYNLDSRVRETTLNSSTI